MYPLQKYQYILKFKIFHCGPDNVCLGTFYEFLKKDVAYQIVLSIMGDGKGWSHPIYLHGNHFYVVKMGF